MARPSEYTPEIASEICRRLSAGATLKEIARDKTMPVVSTVTRWVCENREGFADEYRRARECQGWALADDLVEMIAGLTRDIPEGQAAMPHVLARKYQLDAVKWFLAKVLRYDFGDRLEVQHSSRAEIHLYLPAKGSLPPPVIEGQARQLISDAPSDGRVQEPEE